MLVLSLDPGKYNSMACLMDRETRESQFLTFATDRHYLRNRFCLNNSGVWFRLTGTNEIAAPVHCLVMRQ